MATSEISLPHPHPAWAAVTAQRADHVQLKIADAITAFAGSMPFVYIHAALFVAWMLFLRAKPVADPDAHRLARGDLPVDICDDRTEPTGCLRQGQGRPRLQRVGVGAQDEHRADPSDPGQALGGGVRG